LYADIEPNFVVSHYWLEGWIRGLVSAGYLAGIYCGTNQSGIINGMKAVSGIDISDLIVWSCMPHYDDQNTKADIPKGFGAPGMRVGDAYCDIDMWQYCLEFGFNPKDKNDYQYDFNVATPRALKAMWHP